MLNSKLPTFFALALVSLPSSALAQAFTKQLCETLVRQADIRHEDRVAKVDRFKKAIEGMGSRTPERLRMYEAKLFHELALIRGRNEDLQTLVHELSTMSPEDRDGALGRILINRLVKTQDLGTAAESVPLSNLDLRITGSASLHFRLGTPYAVIVTSASDPGMPEFAHATRGVTILNLLTHKTEPSLKHFKEEALREPYTYWAGAVQHYSELYEKVDTSPDVSACRSHLERSRDAEKSGANTATTGNAPQVTSAQNKGGGGSAVVSKDGTIRVIDVEAAR